MPPITEQERMLWEYEVMGMYPGSHLMDFIRPHLSERVLLSHVVSRWADGEGVLVAGRVVRRQRPLGAAVFMTLEDEYGLVPLRGELANVIETTKWLKALIEAMALLVTERQASCPSA